MGLKEGDFPPVDPATFMDQPYRDRIKVLSRHWAEYGFGAPKITPLIYVAKLLVVYVIGGLLLATLTTGLDPFEPAVWWDQPIIWQKLVVWTMLLEGIGLAGSWGPLAGKFKPMTGGIQYWARPGTIRLPPWPERVPGTRGDERTPLDVALYLGFLGCLALAIALPGTSDSSLTAAIGAGNEGLIAPGVLIAAMAFLLLISLRDKTIFIAARSEQYLPALVFFAFFPFVDMVVAAKILIVSVWVGAAISKFGRHFSNVIPPMVSNTPWLTSKAIKRMHYRNFPEDLRPSEKAVRLAHVGGTAVELATPLVLLFTTNATIALVAACLMIGFHVFITSTFPLAVPLEWNVLFMYLTGFLFLTYANADGYGLADMDPVLLAVTVAGVTFFPILGNNRPDLVSFLPSMRQYAGNWATAMWAFAPGAEEKLNARVKKPAKQQKQQLDEIYGPEAAAVVIEQTLGWRAMHSQGRALNSIMMNTLGPDIDTYDLREAEFACNALIGFNFGDGHLHSQKMLEAVQRRCRFEPGEFLVVWIESEAIGRGFQEYWVMDAAVGIVERGRYQVADCVVEQPWLPNGPIATEVTWRRAGYERVRYERPAATRPTSDGLRPEPQAVA
ncbi:DUF3556 domain-containing protein [Paraconexibacter sp.]|uniref:DUF3556 domain-containing protein n=1 Tax=Paraconexibacter sp. TaxID=2949640 RepID=UPI0035671477